MPQATVSPLGAGGESRRGGLAGTRLFARLCGGEADSGSPAATTSTRAAHHWRWTAHDLPSRDRRPRRRATRPIAGVRGFAVEPAIQRHCVVSVLRTRAAPAVVEGRSANRLIRLVPEVGVE